MPPPRSTSHHCSPRELAHDDVARVGLERRVAREAPARQDLQHLMHMRKGGWEYIWMGLQGIVIFYLVVRVS